ncbi:unnamed protein product, partial [Prorocentrum cordatum]
GNRAPLPAPKPWRPSAASACRRSSVPPPTGAGGRSGHSARAAPGRARQATLAARRGHPRHRRPPPGHVPRPAAGHGPGGAVRPVPGGPARLARGPRRPRCGVAAGDVVGGGAGDASSDHELWAGRHRGVRCVLRGLRAGWARRRPRAPGPLRGRGPERRGPRPGAGRVPGRAAGPAGPGSLHACATTLASILARIAESPDEARVRRLRRANARFEAQVARHACGLGLLRLAGFEEATEDGEPVVALYGDPWADGGGFGKVQESPCRVSSRISACSLPSSGPPLAARAPPRRAAPGGAARAAAPRRAWRLEARYL